MATLREAALKLAAEQPELRRHLIPILRKFASEDKWISDAVEDEGSLRKHYGVPEGETIPVAKMREDQKRLRDKEDKTEAETRLLRRINLALRLRKMK